ncbi:MAG TPA: ABC transporter permease [Planctomycetes bacterium]|nr:ABC transporter permease [Planctomycetota bacterium]
MSRWRHITRAIPNLVKNLRGLVSMFRDRQARQFVTRSLRHHWRINLAVALGVSAATAVLTGALLIGDSTRGSLRQLTLDRLGSIDEILITDRFFRQEMAEQIAGNNQFKTDYRAAAPAILFPQGTVETMPESGSPARAGNVLVLGIESSFWKLGTGQQAQTLVADEGQIILNEPLARDLGAEVGSRVILRLPADQQVHADSPMGDKEKRVRSIPELTVSAVIPAEGLGQFALRSSQGQPRNAYIALPTLQDELRQEGKVNAILVTGKSPLEPPSEKASRALSSLLQPQLEDYGLLIKPVSLNYENGEGEIETVLSYFSLSSQRLMIDEKTESVAQQAFSRLGGQPVLTYLANSMVKLTPEGQLAGDELVPYSLISAIDSQEKLGPLKDEAGKLIKNIDDGKIIINSWLAKDLQLVPGDHIRVTFFEPETDYGKSSAAEPVDLEVQAIAALTEPDKPFGGRRPALFRKPPTLVNDPDLTPEVPGVTDRRSINDWDLPFKLEHRIRGQDDDYWNHYRTTPKAFVSMKTGQSLWSSRFGRVTSFRIPAAAGVTVKSLGEQFVQQVHKSGETLGFEFIPIKRKALAASRGATPFDGLFLSLSFFVIAAGLMLVSLLFRLGVEQRASEIGTLLAMGTRRQQAGYLLVGEGICVACLGALLGIAAGVGYAQLMLLGLRTWWIGAVVSPFLEFHWTFRSLIIGYSLGVLTSVVTIAWSVGRTRQTSVRQLLSGQVAEPSYLPQSQRKGKTTLTVILLLLALVLATIAAVPSIATKLGSEGQAGAFMGAGALVLTALLIIIAGLLKQTSASETALVRAPVLPRFAARNASRNAGRSTVTIGLVASACFLIASLSAFRLDPSQSGKGGFEMVARSSLPIYVDLNNRQQREEFFGEQAKALDATTIFSLRFQPGDDASCNNLYKAQQPRVIGVTPAMIEHFSQAAVPFAWAASAAEGDQRLNPWELLASTSGAHRGSEDDPLPVVIDKNTAMYSLQLWSGVGQSYSVDYENGRTVHFKVVGLLANSILQGSLLISEADFERHYPDVSGYRYFLIDTGSENSDQAAQLLENRFSDEGFDTRSTDELLESLLQVQNTYLSAFQSLGALGLLLGTFGLATVQLRNVLERRAELALMRSTGFPRRRLATMVMLEHSILLLGGLATGIFASLVTVLPHWFSGGAAIPGSRLVIDLLVILVVGLLAGLAAVVATLRAPMISALRGD